MRVARLEGFTGGWFIGAFEPTLLALDAVEVAVKRYRAGDTEPEHVHLKATEVTLVVSGVVEMRDTTLKEGDILVLEPGETAAFTAITEATTVVVKSPSVPGDKYEVG